MRNSIVITAVLGMFAAACAGTIDDVGGGGGGGDDTGGGADCGNATLDSGEACDDGNTASGDGCSATCSTEIVLNPRVTATVDKMTVATELGKTETFTLTLTSVDGFTGNVAIASSLVDAAGAVVPQITVTGPASITLAANAMAPAQYVVTIPSDATGTALAATLKLDVTAPSGATNLTSTINIAPIYTFTLAAATGATINNHPATNKAITIRRGTRLRMMNADTAEHITHGGGGLTHETITPGVTGQPGATYEVNTTNILAGAGKTFGCHTHGDATYATVNLLQ